MMKAAYLAEPLVFTGGYGTRQARAVARLSAPMAGVCKNDLVYFATGEKMLVVGIDGPRLTLLRTDRYLTRYLGGLAYRQWSRTANSYDDEGELIGDYVPAPRRARPLRVRRRHWPDLVIPAGTPLVTLCSAYAEGSHV